MKQKILNKATIIKYSKNCFLLLIPIIIWNLAFRDLLPTQFTFEVYWDDIPWFVYWGENFFRVLVFFIPLLMPLSFFTKRQKLGIVIYLLGTFIYFLSWRPLILYPTSSWSTSLIGFVAPAFTPVIILIGIAIIGNKLFFGFRQSTVVYLIVSAAFTFFHIWHVMIVHSILNF